MAGRMSGRELLVYDGECGFCSAAARWIARRWRVGPTAVPYQSYDAAGLAAIGLTRPEASDAAWWVDTTGRYRGHRAIGQALLRTRARGWHVAGRIALLPAPVAWIAAAAYRWVSSNRHRLPGDPPTCSSTSDATTSGASSGSQ